MLPCNDLPVDNSLPSRVEQPTRKSKGHRKRRSSEKDSSLNDQETDSSSEDDEIALLPYELPCNQREIETENNTLVMERENDFPPNYNAQAGDNGAPGEQTEKDSTGDSELRQSPPAPPNAPGSDVSDEILIERSERPTRSCRVPDRLSYYAPGQACLLQTPYTVDSRPFLTNQPIIV